MVYRAALIGCGRIGSEFDEDPRIRGLYSHAGAYVACSDTRLVAVCDKEASKLRRCAQKWGIESSYQDVRRMLDEVRPDIVSICSPDETHYEVLRCVLDAPGVQAVLAEKPLAGELEQANDILKQASQRNILLAVNYSRRYSSSYLELRQFLDAGKIGKVLTVSGSYTKGIIHNGTHWLDLARFLLGEIVQVLGVDSKDEGGQDPTLDGLIEFVGGAKGYLHGCSFDDEVSFFEMDIVGAGGRVRIVNSGHTISFYELGENAHYAGYKTFSKTREIDGALSYAMLNAVEDLVHSLSQGSEPRCSGRDAVAALKIACALRESARSGSSISLN